MGREYQLLDAGAGAVTRALTFFGFVLAAALSLATIFAVLITKFGEIPADSSEFIAVTILIATCVSGPMGAMAAQNQYRADRYHATLHAMASTDPLTGLLNRRSFEKLAHEEIARMQRTGHTAAIALFDLDHFKQFNDMHGHAFGLDEIISDSLLLLDGGAETTRTVIARTLVELAGRPDQWALLRDGADLTVAVEEFIRWVTPIHNMCRVATTDVKMHGHTIRTGDQLVLMYSSANRDPSHFDDPESFDVTRHPNHHIAFGFGTHFCLGAALARLEIRSFFEEFVARVAEVRLAPGTMPVEMPNSFVHGLREAHLELVPA